MRHGLKIPAVIALVGAVIVAVAIATWPGSTSLDRLNARFDKAATAAQQAEATYNRTPNRDTAIRMYETRAAASWATPNSGMPKATR